MAKEGAFIAAKLVSSASTWRLQEVAVMILFVSGINDQSRIGITLDDTGKPLYLMGGNCSVHQRLPLRQGVASAFTLFGKAVRQPIVELRPQPTLIFNQIADADTHTGALERCIELCEQVSTTVINHPRHVHKTTPDRLALALAGVPGLTLPRTLRFRPRSPDEVYSRATADRIAFPFHVRVAGLHDGPSLIRVGGFDDRAALHALPFDGRDFYLTEHIDYADERGVYSRERIAVIDGEPLLRYASREPDWNAYDDGQAFLQVPENWEEDVEHFDRVSREWLPQARPAIDEITRQLQLEYYGIDCHMRPDGHLVVFEAGPKLHLLSNEHENARYRVDAIVERMHAMLTRYSGEKVI
jgi:hypothetical protein